MEMMIYLTRGQTEEKKNELQIRQLQVGGREGKAEGQGKQTGKIRSLFLSFSFCMPGYV